MQGTQRAPQLTAVNARPLPRSYLGPELLSARIGGATMPMQSEIEAAARVLCRVAYFQLPANERICSADLWPDVDVARTATGGSAMRRSNVGRHSATRPGSR